MTLTRRPTPDVQAALAAWSEPRRSAVERARALIEDIEAAPDGWSFAKLTICNAALKAASAPL
jgi:glutamate dehydrogenase